MTREQFTTQIMAEGFTPAGDPKECILFTLPTDRSGVPECWMIRADQSKAVHYGFTPTGLMQKNHDRTVYFN